MRAKQVTVTCPQCGCQFIPEDTEVRKLAAPMIEQLETQNRTFQAKLKRAGETGERVARLTYTGNRGEEGYAKQEIFTEELDSTFREDLVSIVRRFNAGADVHQAVRYGGAHAGLILWEVKRAADWGRDWLEKLAANRDTAGADFGVIVSAVLPKEVENIARIGDVWVCNFDCAVPVADLLRRVIIAAYRDERADAERHGLEGKAYDYLLKGKFLRRYEDLVRIAGAMLADQMRAEADFARQSKRARARIQELVKVHQAIPGDLYEALGADAELPEVLRGELPAAVPDALPVAPWDSPVLQIEPER